MDESVRGSSIDHIPLRSGRFRGKLLTAELEKSAMEMGQLQPAVADQGTYAGGAGCGSAFILVTFAAPTVHLGPAHRCRSRAPTGQDRNHRTALAP